MKNSTKEFLLILLFVNMARTSGLESTCCRDKFLATSSISSLIQTLSNLSEL